VTTSDVQGMINESLKPINKTLDDVKKKVDNMTKGNLDSDLFGNGRSKCDGGEITFIDIKDGGSTVSKGEKYLLTAKKGPSGNRQPLTTGGGKFVVKLSDGTEQQLESKDNGITASLYVETFWDDFKIIYRCDSKEIERSVKAQ
jgi:hypothetical protein